MSAVCRFVLVLGVAVGVEAEDGLAEYSSLGTREGDDSVQRSRRGRPDVGGWIGCGSRCLTFAMMRSLRIWMLCCERIECWRGADQRVEGVDG